MERLTYTLTDNEAANAQIMDLVEDDVRPLGFVEHLRSRINSRAMMSVCLGASTFVRTAERA
jgi:hypothetical protein